VGGTVEVFLVSGAGVSVAVLDESQNRPVFEFYVVVSSATLGHVRWIRSKEKIDRMTVDNFWAFRLFSPTGLAAIFSLVVFLTVDVTVKKIGHFDVSFAWDVLLRVASPQFRGRLCNVRFKSVDYFGDLIFKFLVCGLDFFRKISFKIKRKQF
jgi:hypothetical protein